MFTVILSDDAFYERLTLAPLAGALIAKKRTEGELFCEEEPQTQKTIDFQQS